jgi:hypothetical protein
MITPSSNKKGFQLSKYYDWNLSILMITPSSNKKGFQLSKYYDWNLSGHIKN